jgi:predicted nucleic acid-binding protein
VKSIFLDSSGLIALLSKNDNNHETAASYWNNLMAQDIAVYLTDYVFDETYTVLHSHVGYKTAIRFGELIMESTVLNLINVDDELFRAAWSIILKYSDKTYSFTDCTSFVVMEIYGIEAAFSFDKHFIQHGFTLLPEL